MIGVLNPLHIVRANVYLLIIPEMEGRQRCRL
jgi:hypothetical protein